MLRVTAMFERLQQPDALRVMYDPLSYAPSLGRLSARLRGAGRAAVNDWLIRHHALRPVSQVEPAQRLVVERLITDWQELPSMALLLGACVHREALLRSPLLLQLPPVAHVFMQFELALPDSLGRLDGTNRVLSMADVKEAGAGCLRTLEGKMPKGLWQRMGLALGTPWVQQCEESQHPTRCAALDSSHLLLAHSYATRNPELRGWIGP